YAQAAWPIEAAAKAEVIGQPLSLLVQPQAVTLSGPRARQQIVVTGHYADGSVRDLTPFCELAFETADVAQLEDGGFILPRKTRHNDSARESEGTNGAGSGCGSRPGKATAGQLSP